MKTIFILLIFFFFFLEHDFYKKDAVKPQTLIKQSISEIDFQTQILPILQKRCSPCHFPGGKMYERLPFDTPATILMKKESILKRIKEENENKLLKEFIESKTQQLP